MGLEHSSHANADGHTCGMRPRPSPIKLNHGKINIWDLSFNVEQLSFHWHHDSYTQVTRYDLILHLRF